MKFSNNTLIYIIIVASIFHIVNAETLTGLQECQAIKNATKKAECFDKVTQKMIKEENERKIKEEVSKVEAEKAKVEIEKAKAEAEIAEAIRVEKIRFSSSAKEVLKSLKRFENRIQTGITLKDYPAVFSDTKFDVKNFIQGKNSSNIQNFNLYCLKAIDNYEDVQAVWNQKIRDSHRYNSDEIYSNFALVDEVKRKYPATVAATRGRAMSSSFAMQVIWSEASANIRKAEEALLLWDREN